MKTTAVEMKANELRIGNFYDHNGVEAVATPNTIEEVWIAERNWVKPIPLTEEWLLKFGFDKKFNKDKITIIPKGRLGYENGRTYFNSWVILEKQPDFVHQLQNLYFALTGEELTFKSE